TEGAAAGAGGAGGAGGGSTGGAAAHSSSTAVGARRGLRATRGAAPGLRVRRDVSVVGIGFLRGMPYRTASWPDGELFGEVFGRRRGRRGAERGVGEIGVGEEFFLADERQEPERPGDEPAEHPERLAAVGLRDEQRAPRAAELGERPVEETDAQEALLGA